MDLIETILVTLVTLGILVAIHEYGHFWVARRCGVKVLRFSIGFGKPIWRRIGADGTEYVVAAVPLGGYVKMLDEREGPVDQNELDVAFNRKPASARIAIVAAGPLANFALAVLAFWLLFMIGVPGVAPVIGSIEPNSIAEAGGLEAGQEIVSVDGVQTPTRQAVLMQLLERLGESGEIHFATRYPPSDIIYESKAPLDEWLKGEAEPDLLGGLGIEFELPVVRPVVDDVIGGGAAAAAGMKTGDLITQVDGIAVDDWEQWVNIVQASVDRSLEVIVEREGGSEALTVTPERFVQEDGSVIGRVGVSVRMPEWPAEMLRTESYGPFAAISPAIAKTWSTTRFTVESVGKMLNGLISPKNLSGPITIAKVATASARTGLETWIGFLGLLSVSLGVLNLLPIPVLDGGHLVYYVIELVKGSPVSERVQMFGYQAGLFVLIGVMMLAFYNDISRLLTN